MAVFTAMREGEARRIRKTAWGSVHDLCDERERLQSPGTESFHQEQRCEVAKILLVCHGKHGAQALKINILRPNIMMCRHG